MDTADIGTMRTNLQQFLKRFDSCVKDSNARNYFRRYVRGLMSNLPRKNCEAMALQTGVPVRLIIFTRSWIRICSCLRVCLPTNKYENREQKWQPGTQRA